MHKNLSIILSNFCDLPPTWHTFKLWHSLLVFLFNETKILSSLKECPSLHEASPPASKIQVDCPLSIWNSALEIFSPTVFPFRLTSCFRQSSFRSRKPSFCGFGQIDVATILMQPFCGVLRTTSIPEISLSAWKKKKKQVRLQRNIKQTKFKTRPIITIYHSNFDY